MGNAHRNSQFTYSTWWFSIAMSTFTRGCMFLFQCISVSLQYPSHCWLYHCWLYHCWLYHCWFETNLPIMKQLYQAKTRIYYIYIYIKLTSWIPFCVCFSRVNQPRCANPRSATFQEGAMHEYPRKYPHELSSMTIPILSNIYIYIHMICICVYIWI